MATDTLRTLCHLDFFPVGSFPAVLDSLGSFDDDSEARRRDSSSDSLCRPEDKTLVFRSRFLTRGLVIFRKDWDREIETRLVLRRSGRGDLGDRVWGGLSSQMATARAGAPNSVKLEMPWFGSSRSSLGAATMSSLRHGTDTEVESVASDSWSTSGSMSPPPGVSPTRPNDTSIVFKVFVSSIHFSSSRR